MHPQAMQWVKDATADHTYDTVVELGARDVNGSVRSLFPNSEYSGVDTGEGPGVTVVCDAADYLPDEPVDCVVSTEMLEHTPRAEEIIHQTYRMLKPGGAFIMTAAGPGRPQHSAIDGMQLRPQEHYANIHPDDLTRWLSDAGFVRYRVDVQRRPADIRCVAYRPEE